jgi:hypothetical protein
MKALSICQPHAGFIVADTNGELPEGAVPKRIENRKWSTRHRGRLLIHAGKSKNWLKQWDGPLPPRMVFGAIVGGCILADVVDVRRYLANKIDPESWRRTTEHQHTDVEAAYWWMLENVHRLETPIPYPGRLGLFDVPDSILAGSVWRACPPCTFAGSVTDDHEN